MSHELSCELTLEGSCASVFLCRLLSMTSSLECYPVDGSSAGGCFHGPGNFWFLSDAESHPQPLPKKSNKSTSCNTADGRGQDQTDYRWRKTSQQRRQQPPSQWFCCDCRRTGGSFIFLPFLNYLFVRYVPTSFKRGALRRRLNLLWMEPQGDSRTRWGGECVNRVALQVTLSIVEPAIPARCEFDQNRLNVSAQHVFLFT